MKFILAILAFTFAVYTANVQPKIPAFKKVDNDCTKLNVVSVKPTDLIGIWPLNYINLFELRCAKIYFYEHLGIYYARYEPVPAHMKETYGDDGIYVDDPENPGILERFLKNSDTPLATKVITAFKAGRYLVCATCDAVDGAPIKMMAIHGRGNITADELEGLKAEAEKAAPNLVFNTVLQDCYI